MERDNKLIEKKWKINKEELEEYLDKPIEKIKKEYKQYMHIYKSNLTKYTKKLNCEKKVIDYYKNTERYFYELIHWESEYNKQKELKKIFLFF